MKIYHFIVCGLATLAFYACDKEATIHTIQGNLKRDCTQPLTNAEVALKTAGGSISTEPLILGSAITSTNGNFQFTYELEENEDGSAELILINKSGYQSLIAELKLGTNLQLKLFEQNTSNTVLTLSGSRQFGSTDTLYYAVDQTADYYSAVQPANGTIDTLNYQIPNSLSNQSEVVFYYGIGLTDFLKAEEALSITDSVYQHLTFQSKGCFGTDEVNLEIN